MNFIQDLKRFILKEAMKDNVKFEDAIMQLINSYRVMCGLDHEDSEELILDMLIIKLEEDSDLF